MNLTVNSVGDAVLSKLYNGIAVTGDGDECMSLCNRDGGFEVGYAERLITIAKGKITVHGEISNIGDIADTPEGRLLVMALSVITTESRTDQTPDQVLEHVKDLAAGVYNRDGGGMLETVSDPNAKS